MLWAVFPASRLHLWLRSEAESMVESVTWGSDSRVPSLVRWLGKVVSSLLCMWVYGTGTPIALNTMVLLIGIQRDLIFLFSVCEMGDLGKDCGKGTVQTNCKFTVQAGCGLPVQKQVSQHSTKMLWVSQLSTIGDFRMVWCRAGGVSV